MMFKQSKLAIALAAVLVVTACSKKPEGTEAKPEATATAEATAETTAEAMTTAPTAEDIAANPEVEGMELTQ